MLLIMTDESDGLEFVCNAGGDRNGRLVFIKQAVVGTKR